MIGRVRLETITRSLGRVENAASSWSERVSLLLTLETESGVFGQGEVAPLPGYSPDSLEACRDALEALDRAALSAIAGEPNALQLLSRAVELLPGSLPAARFGLETALLDLIGKLRQVPAWTLFGARSAPSLPLAAMIGSASDDELLRSAERATLRGIRTLKVKIGVADLALELSALRELKTRLPVGTALRLDANQALAAASLGELAELSPEFVEEPIPATALLELSSSFVPLALDESLQGPEGDADLAKLLDVPNVRAVVLKPMALGGITRCRSIATAAHERRLDVIISHLFDGPLALTAAATLAFQVGSPGVAMGLDRHAGLDAWDCAVPDAIAGARLEGWRGFGLGLPRFGACP